MGHCWLFPCFLVLSSMLDHESEWEIVDLDRKQWYLFRRVHLLYYAMLYGCVCYCHEILTVNPVMRKLYFITLSSFTILELCIFCELCGELVKLKGWTVGLETQQGHVPQSWKTNGETSPLPQCWLA